MARMICLIITIALAGFVVAGTGFAEDRIDCFEGCDTKMMTCLDKCPLDSNKDPKRDCRNACAIDTFHPCLDHCPHPRTGLTPAQKRQMADLEKEQANPPAQP